MFLDTAGNEVDSWLSSPNPNDGTPRRILITADGGFILYGQRFYGWSDPLTMLNPKLLSTLTRRDADFNLVWQKHFGRVGSRSRIWDLRPTPDGGYIGAGGRVHYPDEHYYFGGWLFKFDAAGDSLWSRRDSAFVPPTGWSR